MIKATLLIMFLAAYLLWGLPLMISAQSNTLVILGFASLVFVVIFVIQTLYRALKK